MQTKPHWMFIALAILGGTAEADEEGVDSPSVVAGSGVSRRGVAQDYLVMPSGGELTGQMRFLMTPQPVFGDEPMRFSDLALFGLAGRYSVFSKLELSAQVDFLAKQPSSTDEKPWQSVGFGLRSPIGKRAAIAITGGGGHLIDHVGMWTKEALTLQWRKPIARVVTFDVAATVDAVSLTAPKSKSALITEVAMTGSALFREPSGHWGGWVGIGYAVPVSSRGTDPTTLLAVDPQPRLDFRIGSVLAIGKTWDLFAELVVVDRGDMADPATRLPIIDGGFDQRQIILGVTRHLEGKKPRHEYDDDAYRLSSR